jgi:N4-(beta-N-acetylglucosaminyl)-L-asparaginase
MLAGEGAFRFALANGFKRKSALKIEASVKDWLKTSEYKPVIDRESRHTVCLLSIEWKFIRRMQQAEWLLN